MEHHPGARHCNADSLSQIVAVSRTQPDDTAPATSEPQPPILPAADANTHDTNISDSDAWTTDHVDWSSAQHTDPVVREIFHLVNSDSVRPQPGSTIGTLTSIRKTRTGHLLVETNKALYSQKLVSLTDLAGVPVKAEPHRTLNCCKGVIKCADLKGVDKQEIVDGLAYQGVTDCFNITIPAGNNTLMSEEKPTLTF